MSRVEQIGDATLYLGDCLEILPTLGKVDAVVTDPPYPDWHLDKWDFVPLDSLELFNCRQLIFWSVRAEFPLDYTATHIWDKFPAGLSSGINGYERIFERNGKSNYRMFKGFVISNVVRAMRSRDIFTGHPSQKPIYLIKKLIEYISIKESIVLDPFMGSGTTGVACMNLGRKFIGIEIEPKYFDISCKRIDQAQRQGQIFPIKPPSATQERMFHVGQG